MSFLNQSSRCYNGNDIYSSNKKEISGIGVLEFEDIFEDIDINHLKKTPHNRYEKNTSLHVPAKKNLEDNENTNKFTKEKAWTETLQNQSSFNTFNENPASCNNFKKLNSFYSRALNLNRKIPINEEPILNPFQKKTISSNKCSIHLSNKKENDVSIREENIKLEKKTENSIRDKEKSFNNSISNDESQNIVDLIKHLSRADYPQKNLFSHENNLKLTHQNSSFSYEEFQKLIDNSQPNETMLLPPYKITIPFFKILKPITIQGTVQSVLEITEGPILIDLSNSDHKNGKVIFCECNILFDVFKKYNSISKNTEPHNNFTDSNKSSLNHNSTPNTQRDNLFCLFRVKDYSNLELRDSVIKSCFQTEEMRLFKEIQDICFILKGDISINPEKKNFISLTLKSCRITNFYSVVESHTFSVLSIEKCNLSEMKGHCINASNIFSAKIKQNIFDKIEKSCLNFRFSRQINENSKRYLLIKENEFKSSLSYAISMFSESSQIHQNITFSIAKNSFRSLRKDIIYLKNLSFTRIEVKNNELSSSKLNGITLDKCIDVQGDSQLELSNNKIFNCGGYGISLLDTPSILSNNEVFQNEKGGVNIWGIDFSKPEEIKCYEENPIRVIINESKIFDNSGFGVGITGFMKGPVLIIKSFIYENLDGIFVRENEALKRVLKQKNLKNKLGNDKIGQISLEKCSIFQNKRAGVFLDCLISQAFLSETLIKDNQNQAVILTSQKDKNLINFKDKSSGQLRDFVHGFIGGPWGELYEEKNVSCKGNNKCTIF